jgi:hypothetical protein
MTEDECRDIIARADAAKADREASMPDFNSAISTLHSAHVRLGELGWKDGIYCPKDGAQFALIEFGYTGIFSGNYIGEWPDGHIYAADCIMHPKGIMWKPLDALTDDERDVLARCTENTRQMMERTMAAFADIS